MAGGGGRVQCSVLQFYPCLHVLMFSNMCSGQEPDWARKKNRWHSHMPKHLTQNKKRNMCTKAHKHIKKHTHTHSHNPAPSQSRSDASACACQEHAESAQESERGGLGERHYVCTGCDVPASACQDHTVPIPSAKAHLKEKWDARSSKSK